MTVNSDTGICNLALDLLSAGTIQDINGSNPTEEICARWYGVIRRKLLREHPWNFATKRVILAPDATDPAFGYSTAFSVPADFIRLLALSSNLSVDKETILPTAAYGFENNKILLNQYYGTPDAIRLIYIYDAITVSQFDASFIELFYHDLALALAYKVTESNTNIDRIESLRRTRNAIAKSIDGQERPPQRVERSRALAARRRAGSTHRTDRIMF